MSSPATTSARASPGALRKSTEREIATANAHEVTQERFTRIDRRLLRDLDGRGLASAWHADPVEHALRAARLGMLQAMGLAEKESKGRYRLDDDLEATLRAMGKRGDIIATMHERLHNHPEVLPQDYAVYATGEREAIVGRVLDRGLADEHGDRHYLIVEATDGRTHFVDLGQDLADGATKDRLVRVTPAAVEVRTADWTIGEVAAANGGCYSVDLHLAHDSSATDRFAQAHVRRLEALRRDDATVAARARRHMDCRNGSRNEKTRTGGRPGRRAQTCEVAQDPAKIHRPGGCTARHRSQCRQTARSQTWFRSAAAPLGCRAILRMATRFRRLVKDYERYAETLAGLHLVAFATIMSKQAISLMTGS